MRNWKQAYSLAKFELTYSKLNFLILLATLLTFTLLLVAPVIPKYFEESSIELDAFFILITCAISQWARPKGFQIQKVGGYFRASHFIITLSQLPITKEIIVKYRFLSYFILSFSINLLFFTFIYIFSPALRDLMPIETYLVFSIFWFCFSIYIGSSQIVSDAGTNILLTIVVSFLFIAPLSVVLIIILFYKNGLSGLVPWTMFISIDHPLLTVTISILLAIIGAYFWMDRMRRKLDKVDYLW